MTRAALKEVVNCMTVKGVESGKVVVEYGDVGDNFYLVLTGKVNIQVPKYDTMKRFKHLQANLTKNKDELQTVLKTLERIKKTREKLER
jgi:hypothetical protein